MDKLTGLLNEFVNDGLVAGAYALITREGKETYFNAAGLADMNNNIPMARDTVLRVYSMTKPVTAAAALMLIERGVFSLNTPISEFIPEFKDTPVCVEIDGAAQIVPAKRQITVFDLLTMTSGLSYGDNNELNAATTASNAYVTEVFLKMRDMEKEGEHIDSLVFSKHLAKCPLCFHPGEQWRYGLSSDVLGAVIAVASGKTLGEFFEENIFKPLKMENTCFNNPKAPESIMNRLAKTYIPTPRGLTEKRRPLVFEMAAHPTFEAGGAGLISTLDDYGKFGNMLLNEGELNGVRILRADSVRRMKTNQLNENQMKYYDWDTEKGYGYGFSVRVMLDPAAADHDESVGSFGWNGAASTSLRIDPIRRSVLVFGCQRMPPDHNTFMPRITKTAAEQHF